MSEIKKNLEFECPFPTIGELIEKATAIWPDISVGEIIIDASTHTMYQGDDTTVTLRIEPTEDYLKRI